MAAFNLANLNTAITGFVTRLTTRLNAKADLENGKVKAEQLPAMGNIVDKDVYVSTLDPDPATGKNGDIYFVVDE